ncbi:CpsD/CapB family tyrosine-protein kinase, partial [Patulibacter sp. S7RM1-6]
AELLRRIPVPVLAGVPAPGRGAARIDTAPATREAFRTLQIQLDLRGGDDGAGRTLLVTSASAGDGKTTTVLNLAFALVGAGHRVIVIDFDLRAPRVGAALGLDPQPTALGSLTGGAGIADVMRPAPLLPPLRVVSLAGGSGDAALLPALSRRMEELLDEARTLADHVIVDTAPLGEVGDALPLLEHVDDVLLVGRPGATDRGALDAMAGLLERAGTTPAGWVVTGVEAPASRYHDVGEPSRRRRPARA